MRSQDLGWSMIAIGTFLVIAKFVIQVHKEKFWLLQDCVVVLGWACHVAMCVCYVRVTDTMYRIAGATDGEEKPYSDLNNDVSYLSKMFFPATLLLWCCLWLVKWSLLLNCRRLVGRRHGFIIIWWCIATFCVLAFVGCFITQVCLCGNLRSWFQLGLNQKLRV